MLKKIKDGRIPSNMVPKCPICGREMATNLRCDDRFVEDEGWIKASKRYQEFLIKNKNVLFLELGVDWNTPVIIKYPFIRMAYDFKNSYYVCINKWYNKIPNEIKNKSLLIDDNIKNVIERIIKV